MTNLNVLIPKIIDHWENTSEFDTMCSRRASTSNYYLTYKADIPKIYTFDTINKNSIWKKNKKMMTDQRI